MIHWTDSELRKSVIFIVIVYYSEKMQSAKEKSMGKVQEKTGASLLVVLSVLTMCL